LVSNGSNANTTTATIAAINNPTLIPDHRQTSPLLPPSNATSSSPIVNGTAGAAAPAAAFANAIVSIPPGSPLSPATTSLAGVTFATKTNSPLTPTHGGTTIHVGGTLPPRITLPPPVAAPSILAVQISSQSGRHNWKESWFTRHRHWTRRPWLIKVGAGFMTPLIGLWIIFSITWGSWPLTCADDRTWGLWNNGFVLVVCIYVVMGICFGVLGRLIYGYDSDGFGLKVEVIRMIYSIVPFDDLCHLQRDCVVNNGNSFGYY
jgi:hypothetical protein